MRTIQKDISDTLRHRLLPRIILIDLTEGPSQLASDYLSTIYQSAKQFGRRINEYDFPRLIVRISYNNESHFEKYTGALKIWSDREKLDFSVQCVIRPDQVLFSAMITSPACELQNRAETFLRTLSYKRPMTFISTTKHHEQMEGWLAELKDMNKNDDEYESDFESVLLSEMGSTSHTLSPAGLMQSTDIMAGEPCPYGTGCRKLDVRIRTVSDCSSSSPRAWPGGGSPTSTTGTSRRPDVGFGAYYWPPED